MIQNIMRTISIFALLFLLLLYQNCGVTDYEFIAAGDDRITFEESSNAQVQELLARNGYRPGPRQLANFHCRLMNIQTEQSGEGYVINFLSFDQKNPFAGLSNLRAFVHFYDSSRGTNSSSVGYRELIMGTEITNAQEAYQLVNQKQISIKFPGYITQTLNYYIEIKDQRDQLICATQQVKVHPFAPTCSLQVQGSSRLYNDDLLRVKINHNLAVQFRSNWQIESRMTRVVPPTVVGGASTIELSIGERIEFTNEVREVDRAQPGTYRLEYDIFLGNSSVPTCRTNSISYIKFDALTAPPVYGNGGNQTGSGSTGGGNSGGGGSSGGGSGGTQ